MYHDQQIGMQLRDWRRRRRLSQLDLALEAELSARHLSFVESGRSRPSRDTILRLATALDVPLRSRNALLLAGGYAPVFPERLLETTEETRAVVQQVLDCHLPFPSLAIDRHWNLVANNAAVPPLLSEVAPFLLQAPVNVLRLSLHPQGLAPRIGNLAEWKHHLVARLQHQFAQSGDPVLKQLREELKGYPAPASRTVAPAPASLIATPLKLETAADTLDLLSTTTVFGTPVEVTLSELAIETFFPANASTSDRLRALQVA